MKKKAVILFSGGLDSTVLLALALQRGLECHALSFDYGQRHKVELDAARKIASHYGISHHIIKIDPSSFHLSSLVSTLDVPKNRTPEQINNSGVPNTYVPGRNTLFLAYAISQAEILNVGEIHIGFNALDRNPYPDCRPEFVAAFQNLIDLATKQSTEGNAPKLMAPLISWDKKEIYRQGLALQAPLHLTFSCYDPTPSGNPCSACDACILRKGLV